MKKRQHIVLAVLTVISAVLPASGVAQDTTIVNVSVCTVQNGQLSNVTAAYNPSSGDTTGLPVAESWAGSAVWYINNDPISFNRQRYVKYGLPRVLGTTDVTNIGQYQGIPVFAEPGATAAAEVVYIPVGSRCEFQPYQIARYAPDETTVALPNRTSTQFGRLSTANRAAYLTATFEIAAGAFGVPAELLSAIGYVETGWDPITVSDPEDGQRPKYGLMALDPDQVRQGSRLTEIPESDVKRAILSNTLAAAAILNASADSLRIDRSEIRSWAPVIARFSRIVDPALRDAYVERVFEVIAHGRFLYGAQGDSVQLLGQSSPQSLMSPAVGGATADDPSARWDSALYFRPRPAPPTGTVLLVVIHTCDDSYHDCMDWFKNPQNPYKTSAHYVVSREGEITQMVREANRANHIIARYNCAYNSRYICARNGTSINNFSIGIEHEGFSTQQRPQRQLEASARLACSIASRHHIPIQHIRFIAHGQMQSNRSDPGLTWNWTEFMRAVARDCHTADPGLSPPRPLLGLGQH